MLAYFRGRKGKEGKVGLIHPISYCDRKKKQTEKERERKGKEGNYYYLTLLTPARGNKKERVRDSSFAPDREGEGRRDTREREKRERVITTIRSSP